VGIHPSGVVHHCGAALGVVLELHLRECILVGAGFLRRLWCVSSTRPVAQHSWAVGDSARFGASNITAIASAIRRWRAAGVLADLG